MRRSVAFNRAWLALPVVAFIGACCLVPLGILVVFSFFVADLGSFTLIPTFSLQSWAQIFSDPIFVWLVGKALVFGGVTAILAVFAGYPIALAMAQLHPLWKGTAAIVLLTPLYTGEIVRIYAWRIVLGAGGLVNSALMGVGLIDEPLQFLLFSPFTSHLVLLYNNLPFMVMAIWVSAELVDHRLIEAARDLGARRRDAFFQVTLPLTTPGLAVGSFTVFALSAGDMMTPKLLGGTTGTTPMSMIDSLFGTTFDWPLASALSLTLLLVLFGFACLFATLIFRTKGARAVLRGRMS